MTRLQCCVRCGHYYMTRLSRITCSRCVSNVKASQMAKAYRQAEKTSGRIVGEALAKFYKLPTAEQGERT